MTDGHLRVLGADNIYALGDAATIAQPRALERAQVPPLGVHACQPAMQAACRAGACTCSARQPVSTRHIWVFVLHVREARSDRRRCRQEMFEEADKNGDGLLQLDELRFLLRKASKEFTHLEEHATFLDQCAALLGDARVLQTAAQSCALHWPAALAGRHQGCSAAQRRRGPPSVRCYRVAVE